MSFIITSIRPSHGGEEVELRIEANNPPAPVNRACFLIATDFYQEAELPFSLSSPMEITEEAVRNIEHLAARTFAIKKGADLLGFGENTAKSLCQKLIMRGCKKEAAEEAVAYLSEHGFINEKAQAENLIVDLASKRHYGKSRIQNDLYAKGFSADVIRFALEENDIPFARFCAERIRQMGGLSLFADQKSRIKTYSALARYGYSYDDIKDALLILGAKR